MLVVSLVTMYLSLSTRQLTIMINSAWHMNDGWLRRTDQRIGTRDFLMRKWLDSHHDIILLAFERYEFQHGAPNAALPILLNNHICSLFIVDYSLRASGVCIGNVKNELPILGCNCPVCKVVYGG